MNHTLDELLFHMRAIAGGDGRQWAAGFAKSIIKQSGRRNWRPTHKQEGVMRRLVAELFANTADDLEVIEDG
ncbi:MAG: hypothetical protein KDK24_19115 [Pseudooceanicola sp.]|nr:hypothetical protein [Pseudooceanicola sp.]